MTDMGKGYRTGRLGEEIKRIISSMLISGIKDPRLQDRMISVSAVEVTRDGSYATCYITVLGSPSESGEERVEKEKEILEGLNSARGLLRHEVSRSIKLRHTPELIFKIDNSMEYGRHISDIIEGLDIKDEDDDEE